MKKAFRPRISAGLVLTTALALFNLGHFGFILLAGHGIQKKLKEAFAIQVYLEKGILPHQLQEISKQLGAMHFTARNLQGIPLMQYESKEEAGKRFIRETGEDFMQFLGENPLRDAFLVHVSASCLHPDSLRRIRSDVSQIAGVFEVTYMENLAGSLESNVQKIAGFFLFASLILFLTVFWLLRTSIRSAIYSGRFFIRSMELLGASPWFIRRPYVLAIGLGGLLGGILASVMLAIACWLCLGQFPELIPYLSISSISWLLFSLVPAGFLLSFLPALNGIRAYQQKTQADLHKY